jgi:dienelactone hydrolase
MPVTGKLAAFIQQQALHGIPPLSFLHERFPEVMAWRDEVRDYLRSLLMFTPEFVELSPELVDHTETADGIQQKWYITPSQGERMPVILLIPRGLTGPAPAIIGLHCHGDMYYFGKKKLIEEESDPPILRAYRDAHYEGVAIANDLVRRGYVVAVIDSFYFGERRLVVPPPPMLQPEFLLVAEGSDHWIELLNRVSGLMEETVAKSLLWAGVTWPGILAWDDQRTVDFLLTRPEVDPGRLGCVGLGGGAFRATLLGALDTRVKAVCTVGWMSTLPEMLDEHVPLHSWAHVVPGLTRVLDWPDVAALHAPHPLLILQGSQDPHFPLDGFQKADERLRAVYAKSGSPGNLDVRLYDVGFNFSREMQRQAWTFFDDAFGLPGEPAPDGASPTD